MISLNVGYLRAGPKLREAKAAFFDRPRVQRAMDEATQRVLSKFGAFVRQTARKSLRRAAQVTLASMTPKERQTFRIRQAVAKRKGQPPPRRPDRASKPGRPPFMHVGLLKQLLFFGYDRRARSVVIGPAILDYGRTNPTVPEVLEHGGWTQGSRGRGRVYVGPRPYMWPAYEKEEPKLADLWRNSVKP